MSRTSTSTSTTYNTASSVSATKEYLTIRPLTSAPVLYFPPDKLFIIHPTTSPPFRHLVIPTDYHLLLWPHPGPLPSSTADALTPPPAYTLTPKSDTNLPFPPDKPVSYYAILHLTPSARAQRARQHANREQLETTRREALVATLHGLREESTEHLATRTQYGNHVPQIVLPSFYLRAIAALGDLLSPEYTSAAHQFVSLFNLSRGTAITIDGEVSFPKACQAFFEKSLDEESQLYADALFQRNDPVRLALFSISDSLAEESEEGTPDPAAVLNVVAFRELFKVLALNGCVVWDIAESWSPSFGWQLEVGLLQKFMVSNVTFKDSRLVLPVNVKTGFNTTINIGLTPDAMQYLYPVRDVRSYLSRQSSVTDALFAAANYGADWERVMNPDNLSSMRNTASFKMDTSGGVVYKGLYIDSPGAVGDILMFGKVRDVKLVDLSSADFFPSNALRSLANAVGAVRRYTKGDAKTFKTTFGRILADIRRRICLQVAEYGLVFKTEDGYEWIGVDDTGYMKLKKAVPFDGDPQSMPLPVPNMGPPPPPVIDQPVDTELLPVPVLVALPEDSIRQDMSFLVKDVEGMKLESTSSLANFVGEGDVGVLVLLAAVRFCRVGLDAGFTHALTTQRMPMSLAMEKGDMSAMKTVKVDTPMKYASLMTLEDNVVIDHDGQGWICGVDYLRGRNGAPGKIMAAETEGCAPMPIVEVDFSISDTRLVSP